MVLDKRPDGRLVAKIADFGWIKMNASKSGPDGKMPMSMPAVTQPYRAPELLMWLYLCDPFAVDIWSFGVLCLDCLIRPGFLYAPKVSHAESYHQRMPVPTYTNLVQVVLKVTGGLTESHLPTLMKRAAQDQPHPHLHCQPQSKSQPQRQPQPQTHANLSPSIIPNVSSSLSLNCVRSAIYAVGSCHLPKQERLSPTST